MSGIYSLIVVVAVLALVVLEATAAAIDPIVDPTLEAEYVDLDTTRELLPNSAAVSKIQKEVALIRSQQEQVSKTFNKGRKHLGRLHIGNYSGDVETIINRSKFGPVLSANEKGVIGFDQHFNPDVLVVELKKLGVQSSPIWIKGLDYGTIQHNPKESTYTFREGLENCKLPCKMNRFFVYKMDNKGQSRLIDQYAVDIAPHHH